MANTYFDTAKITAEATAVAVSSVGSSNITTEEADLEGSLDDLGGNSSVDVSFEYREVGASSWNQTSPITKSATGSYTQTVSGLNSDTDYEFRAFGKGNDSGETATGSTLTFTTTAEGRTAGVIDDVEDNDISEYDASVLDGTASTSSSVVKSGSYSIEMNSDADGELNSLISLSGLNTYPQAGDTFEAWVYPQDSKEAGIRFGMQEQARLPTGYRFVMYPANDLIDLRLRNPDDSQTTLASTSVTIPDDPQAWYRLEVEWGEGGSITCTLYNDSGSQLAQISATDSTYTEGGFAWHSFQTTTGSTAPNYYDDAEITSTSSGTGVIDDFEDGDIAEYSGTKTDYSVQTGTVFEGTYALEKTDTTFESLTSTSGLPRYPSQGDTFQVKCRTTDITDYASYMIFGYQDSDNFYRVTIRRDDSASAVFFEIQKFSGGNFNELSEVSFTGTDLSSNAWHTIEVDWADDGTITATAYDSSDNQVVTTSATDTEYTGGGFGLILSNPDDNASVYADLAEITSTTTDTTSTGPVDDFEDNDMSEYTITAGDSSEFTVQTSTVFEGSYALETTPDGSGGLVLLSDSGLPRYPEAGDVFSWRGYLSSSTGNNNNSVFFGAQETSSRSNNYNARIQGYSGDIVLRKWSGGSASTIASTSVSGGIPQDEWLRGKVEWNGDGSMTFTLFDAAGNQLAQISGTDTDYTSGGAGYESAADNVTYYDIYKIV
jgi:hypothetical protein